MSEELDRQKAVEFEKVFGFLPETEAAADQQGFCIVTKVLAFLRECADAKRTTFDEYAERASLAGEDTLKNMTMLRSMVKVAEQELDRAEFMARETGYTQL